MEPTNDLEKINKRLTALEKFAQQTLSREHDLKNEIALVREVLLESLPPVELDPKFEAFLKRVDKWKTLSSSKT